MNCRGSLALSLALACTPGGSGTETTASSSSSTSATDPAPTTGEPVELQRCTPTCSLDADCLIAGQDSGFRCIAGACQVPPCSDDAACAVMGPGFRCTTQFSQNYCKAACGSDLDCGTGLWNQGTPDPGQPWNYYTCDLATGACGD